MSFLYKRGETWYLGFSVPVTGADGKTRMKQRGVPISKDLRAAKDFKVKWDYDRTVKRLGVVNDRKTWHDLKATFLQQFGERTKENKPSTLGKYLDSWRHFEDVAKPGYLSAFTHDRALKFKGDMIGRTYKTPTGVEKTYSSASINIALRNLRTTFKLALKLRWIFENPFDGVPEIDEGERLPKAMTDDELNRFFDAARFSPNPDTYVLAMTYYYTGLRRTTLTVIKRDAVDLMNRVIYIRGTPDWKPKDRDDATVPIHPALFDVLRKYMESRRDKSPFLFPGRRGGRRNKHSVGQLFNRVYKRAGLPYRGVHVLRHTFTTNMLKVAPPNVVQQLLGHSDIRTTLRYSHVRRDELAAAVNLLKDVRPT